MRMICEHMASEQNHRTKHIDASQVSEPCSLATLRASSRECSTHLMFNVWTKKRTNFQNGRFAKDPAELMGKNPSRTESGLQHAGL